MKFLILASLLASALAHAEGEPPNKTTPVLRVPLYDAPFNYERGGYSFPSMRQGLDLSTDYYENVHRWIGGTGNPWDETGRFFGVIGFDLFSYWLPLGSNWMRAEWHRSVLTRNEISSYDETYHFPVLSDSIKVTQISDTDLSRLKTDHPADFVRMESAGFESRMAQNLLVERHHFFDDADTFDQFLLWMNALNSTVYLSVCGSQAADVAIQKMQSAEGTDIGKRDFSGLDCTAWVYDLFRPNEAYSARGVHPSGVGINRYITHAQLGNRETEYLRRQQFLSLLNFADPFLYGREGWTGKIFGQEVRWNANVAHTLTSFGYVMDARLFVRHDLEKYLITLHNGFGSNYNPGLSAEWIEHPIGDGFAISGAFTVWPQPKGQRYEERNKQWMVDASTEFLFRWTPLTATFFGVEAKTPGWMLGTPYLDGNLSVWTGFRTTLF
ncbi:MAG: hypothetical protein ACXWR1_05190 [Bdellovibrionota bacterium]